MNKIIFSNDDLFISEKDELKKIAVGDTVRVYLKNDYDYAGIVSSITEERISLNDLNCSSSSVINNNFIKNIEIS